MKRELIFLWWVALAAALTVSSLVMAVAARDLVWGIGFAVSLWLIAVWLLPDALRDLRAAGKERGL